MNSNNESRFCCPMFYNNYRQNYYQYPIMPVQPIRPIVNPVYGNQLGTEKYRFNMDTVDIRNTRSLLEDNVVISLVALVNGRETGKTVIPLGHKSNGIYLVNLSFDVEVGPYDTVSFGYIVANTHNSTSEHEKLVQGAIKMAADKTGAAIGAAAGSIVGGPIGGLVGAAAGEIINLAADFFEADHCDGVVAADTIAYTSNQLRYFTTFAPITKKLYYPGTNSPLGCGSNSQYFVSWTIVRL
ncbi:MAG: hypothetical protein Q8936_23560 [Bacillota bacterium]|nr:hypothetical protein [Bacillota bacterium]